MDNFMQDIRLDLEKILTDVESETLESNKRDHVKNNGNNPTDEEIIAMIASIYVGEYATQISQYERNLVKTHNWEDAKRAGNIKTWEEAKDKIEIEERLLNTMYITDGYSEEFNMILLADMFNCMAHYFENDVKKEDFFALKDKVLQRMIEKFPKKDCCVLESNTGNAKNVVYFRIFVSEMPKFFSWHTQCDFDRTEKVAKTDIYKEIINYIELRLYDYKLREFESDKNMAEIENKPLTLDKWVTMMNGRLISDLINNNYEEEINKIFEEVREKKAKELPKEKRKPTELTDTKKNVLAVFSEFDKFLEDPSKDVADYDFSDVRDIRGIPNNVKKLLNLVSSKSVNDELIRNIILALAMREILQNSKLKSPELVEIYNKVTKKLENKGTKISKKGKGKQNSLVICIDEAGNIRDDRYLTLTKGEWKSAKRDENYREEVVDENLKFIRLDLYDEKCSQRYNFECQQSDIEKLPVMTMDDFEGMFVSKEELEPVYEGTGSYDDSIIQSDEQDTPVDNSSREENKITAEEIDEYLADEEVKGRMNDILGHTTSEQKMEIMKLILDTLSPVERVKYLNELLKDTTPGDSSSPGGSSRNGGMIK